MDSTPSISTKIDSSYTPLFCQRCGYDKLRTEFLSFLYSRNFEGVEGIYKELQDKIDRSKELSEVDQKAMNQMQRSFKTFFGVIRDNCSTDTLNRYEHLHRKIADTVKYETKKTGYVEYDAWMQKTGLTKTHFRILLQTVTSLQLTVGCSNFCRRCNEWALPGVRKHFSFQAAKKFITQLFEIGNNEFILYSASDPLDWRHEDKRFIDIVEFMAESSYSPRYGILTKVPRGADRIAEKLLRMNADIGVSLTKRNRGRIQKVEEKAGKTFAAHHDVDQLLIPAGFDEDFVTIKSTIIDNYGTEITPEGAFIIVPTFTSALNPTGQYRIPVTAKTPFFLKKKTGAMALPIQYFKPLRGINLMGDEFTLERLLNPQIENILLDTGSDELTPPGMMSLREYFKTFEPDAVKRRGSLFPSVVKGLQETLISQKNDEGDWQERCDFFRRQCLNYSELCQPNSVMKYQKNAFSFYLKSIAEYLKHHPVEREIISFLRKEERKEYGKRVVGGINGHLSRVEPLLEEPEMLSFDVFQILLFELFDNPNSDGIWKFIEKNPVAYDPEIDQFTDQVN